MVYYDFLNLDLLMKILNYRILFEYIFSLYLAGFNIADLADFNSGFVCDHLLID